MIRIWKVQVSFHLAYSHSTEWYAKFFYNIIILVLNMMILKLGPYMCSLKEVLRMNYNKVTANCKMLYFWFGYFILASGT